MNSVQVRQREKVRDKPYLDAVERYLDLFRIENGRKPVLLDGGCGHRSFIADLYKKSQKVVGVDLDDEALKRNRLVHKKVVADLGKLPLLDSEVDFYTTAWVLEHIQEPELLVKEASRVIKSGGYFVFICPNLHSLPGLISKLLPPFIQKPLVSLVYKRKKEDTYRTLYRFNTEKKIDKLMGEYGFKKIEFIYNDDIMFLGSIAITYPIAKIWHKIIMTNAFKKFRANIIGVYKLEK